MNKRGLLRKGGMSNYGESNEKGEEVGSGARRGRKENAEVPYKKRAPYATNGLDGLISERHSCQKTGGEEGAPLKRRWKQSLRPRRKGRRCVSLKNSFYLGNAQTPGGGGGRGGGGGGWGVDNFPLSS